MKVYADTSAVLSRVLHEPGAIQDWASWESVVSSELMRVEAFRKLDRLRITGKADDLEMAQLMSSFREVTARFEIVPIDSKVLQRAASPFSTALGTLDAIHLSTALLWVEQNNETLTFLTHDAELALAARACGLDVLP